MPWPPDLFHWFLAIGHVASILNVIVLICVLRRTGRTEKTTRETERRAAELERETDRMLAEHHSWLAAGRPADRPVSAPGRRRV